MGTTIINSTFVSNSSYFPYARYGSRYCGFPISCFPMGMNYSFMPFNPGFNFFNMRALSGGIGFGFGYSLGNRLFDVIG